MSKKITDVINPETNAMVMASFAKHREAEAKELATDPPTHKEDPLLTTSEVARQLGKSPQTIGRWIADGLLKAVALPGGRLAIRKSIVNQFLGGSALQKEVH